MNNKRGFDIARPTVSSRLFLWAIMLAALTFAVSCGGEKLPATTANQYPAGSVSNEDIEKTLKFDARVQTHEFDGDKLVVEVNQSWISSPPGMQERAIGEWYNMWQAARSGQAKGLEVIVRHEGNEIARWTGEGGYQPVEQPKAVESDSTS